ncbi:MAG: helix-turn-helix transcriptional regulator [Erysipelotrichaceae bacterium]|nr:helix-turn-helix transcriptional regulator [Erysipelotrichaceae bacterium]
MKAEEIAEMIQNTDLDEDCPVEKTIDLLAGKWTTKIIYQLLMNNVLRFGEFKKNIPEITNAMLSSTLKELEGKGIITRKQYNEVPLRVEYSLTEAGQAMLPIFLEMGKWGIDYLK